MPKNIVVCCDGTGNEYGENNTNVVKLCEIIEKGTSRQIVYYDPGVGTISTNVAITIIQKRISKLLGLLFGYGITKNIEDAYEFLMNEYEEDDYVYLFGFSRGAFTVRALAGMIHKCGMLQKGSNNLVRYATRMYRKGSPETAAGFKKTFSRECRPHFIGVWDTVKSVGMFVQNFPNTKLNPDVNIGIHAVSIDERRRKFKPNLWDELHDPEDHRQFIRQVWFAGVHSDVGGFYKEHGLSDCALKWVIDEAKAQGLIISQNEYEKIQENPADKLHNSLLPFWWILGWITRKINEGAFIHKTVFERMDKRKEYNPKNLPDKEKVIVVS